MPITAIGTSGAGDRERDAEARLRDRRPARRRRSRRSAMPSRSRPAMRTICRCFQRRSAAVRVVVREQRAGLGDESSAVSRRPQRRRRAASRSRLVALEHAEQRVRRDADRDERVGEHARRAASSSGERPGAPRRAGRARPGPSSGSADAFERPAHGRRVAGPSSVECRRARHYPGSVPRLRVGRGPDQRRRRRSRRQRGAHPRRLRARPTRERAISWCSPSSRSPATRPKTCC